MNFSSQHHSFDIQLAAKFAKALWYAFADEKMYGVDHDSIDEMEENSKNLYERQQRLTQIIRSHTCNQKKGE